MDKYFELIEQYREDIKKYETKKEELDKELEEIYKMSNRKSRLELEIIILNSTLNKVENYGKEKAKIDKWHKKIAIKTLVSVEVIILITTLIVFINLLLAKFGIIDTQNWMLDIFNLVKRILFTNLATVSFCEFPILLNYIFNIVPINNLKNKTDIDKLRSNLSLSRNELEEILLELSKKMPIDELTANLTYLKIFISDLNIKIAKIDSARETAISELINENSKNTMDIQTSAEQISDRTSEVMKRVL